MFMADQPTAPGPNRQPDPQDQAPAATSGRFGHVLGIVRCLIDFGRQVVANLRQPDANPCPVALRYRFGTIDVRQILDRLIRALHRATALEARLEERAAKDPRITALQAATPLQAVAPEQRQPRARPSDSPRPKRAERFRFDHLPELERIAAEARRRPIGAVLIDICCELGLMPSDLDQTIFNELVYAISCYNGSLRRYLRVVVDAGLKRLNELDPADMAMQAPSPHAEVPDGTGPPGAAFVAA